MTLAFWEHCANGALLEEYLVVKPGKDRAQRYLDAIILPDGPMGRFTRDEHVELKDKNVIVVQTKIGRMGMYLMGQALFSVGLVKQAGAASVRSILLCTKTDSALLPLLDPFPEVEVWTLDLAAGDKIPRRAK